MTRTFGSLARDVPKRLVELVIKMVGAKGLFFAVATVLLALRVIDGWQWIAVGSVFVGTRAAEKLIGRIKGG